MTIFFKSQKSYNLKDELIKHRYKLVYIISEDKTSIKFREYFNCCSNEFKTAIIKGKSIIIFNEKNQKIDKFKVK